MKQWDHDCAASERIQAQQTEMARRDAGDANALSWAWSRAKLAEAQGLVPCPDCGCGFYGGCEACNGTGILNADGSKRPSEWVELTH